MPQDVVMSAIVSYHPGSGTFYGSSVAGPTNCVTVPGSGIGGTLRDNERRVIGVLPDEIQRKLDTRFAPQT